MGETVNILMAAGENAIWDKLSKALAHLGYNVKISPDGNDVLSRLNDEEFQVMLISPESPGIDANGFLEAARNVQPFIEIIVLAEDGTIRSAFDFMRLGAYDYLTGPFEAKKVISVTRRAVEHVAKSRRGRSMPTELSRRSISYNMVGESPVMKDLYNTIYKVSPTDSTVLIQGETGTGKGLIADAIHQHSKRSGRSPTTLNCGAIPETLMESELFGYEKGAFTGADRAKPGLLEVANGGTIFLDEVGELRSDLQSKLLRVIETGRFRRLGSTRETQIDTRIISATNKAISGNGAKAKFREDLYYRLSVVTIDVPPLRERPEDIPRLADFFLDNLKASGKGRRTISPEAMGMLQSYDWPGNIRELRNVIERLIILAGQDTIEPANLPAVIQKHKTVRQMFLFPREDNYFTLGEMEQLYIEKVLDHCRGHRTQTAKTLGITRATLYNKLKLFGIAKKKGN